ncbi:ABC transporter ATP-binding protein [Fibrella forsythiae]|uniref:Sn-glycerol-3-phosphate ABC transporter ATP-binding protein UgpC n=1 Tax=Fibrella forsythiae TaxID=2817061 RepID=A0ABS3JDC8_9BACT|nr:sn-glycerol-3-phosphate ABC transporter ATP-binding protein UgpC [Fibrella forsythiae]MBO0947996.1 sn-glycerol-3-phosphate ABC transporter ATP-binding protein UgpC [Fibrella forsythiae]
MATITLSHIAKAYGSEARVIKDVSLTVNDREFVVFVGPSGCGKSTLLRMIAGLEAITDGDLLLNGDRINDHPPKDRDIAMVFQNYALYPHMTVYENMSFGLKLRHVSKAGIKERVTQAARILEIENLLDRKPKDMSGGQRQRVAIGRAIVREPKVFLFDEPLSNLDAKLRGQTRLELQKLHRSLQATIIYVTHDQVEAMTLGDRICVLRGGDVMQFDTPVTLYNEPANLFVAGFIGSPPMNFLPGKLMGTGNSVQFESESGTVCLELSAHPHRDVYAGNRGRAVVLGIRAEHITDRPGTFSHSQSTTVDALEHLGNEIFAYTMLEGVRFVARLPADSVMTINNTATLYWQADKCHIFDAQTERRL